ncbi:WG containing repeat-containing protein [Maribacter sedimenticola]|uniref:WG containing repeat-containing protein n=1 Tax=Maribacter sedimenticola TaxID=228956 RepID=A0ABY1SFZ2_9FLAO|nr:WG repeat-containing protein [Maribacter sedimenticola]SNR40747.1 WG containing repeat-containing protein [Maribacter sedimenticola]
MKNRLMLLAITVLAVLPVSAQMVQGIDEIAPFIEGLAAVRKGGEWGFIDEEGKLVIDFSDDVYWNPSQDNAIALGAPYPMFNEGLCAITQKVEDGVPVFGFMDKTGAVVFPPQFLNVTPFKDGYATAVFVDKTFKGENEFKLKIYEYKFFDVLISSNGEIAEYFGKRDHIQMTVKRYKVPTIGAKMLNAQLVATHKPDQGWAIQQLQTKN